MKKILFILAFSLCIIDSIAAVRNWVGAGSATNGSGTVLNTVSNWSGSGALLGSDDLVITLDNNPTITIALTADLTVNSLTINSIGNKVSSGGNTFTIDLGNYTFSTSNNCSITNSSKPPGNQSNRPFDIIVTNAGAGAINIGGNLTSTNTNISQSANSIQFLIYGTMTVSGTSLANSFNPSTNSTIGFLVGNAPAKIIFNGNVTLDDNTSIAENTIFLGSILSAGSGSVEFKSNLSLGKIASTNTFFTDATVIFNGAATQTFTHGNSNYNFRLPHVIIGNSNNPTVIFASANSVIPNNLTGNLTVNGSSILDLGNLQWNRNSNGGTFLLKNTSTLKLSAATSVVNGGTATLIAGSNFPAGFTTVTLDSSSTVAFNGSAQTIPLPTAATLYGNLMLSGSGIKTVGSSMSINKTLSINTGVTMALVANDITLRSNKQTTANVGEVLGNITYGTGRFIVERFLRGVSSWRLLSTPVEVATSPTINSSWREGATSLAATGYGTRITGPSGISNPITSAAGNVDEYTQRASMKYYDMATNVYKDVRAADLSGVIARNEGYYVFVRGDRGVAVNGGTGITNLRIRGKLRTGNQAFSIIKDIAPATGFQSVGNPFASQIDVRNFITVANGVAETFFIWNPNGGFYGVGQFENYSKNGLNFRRNGSPAGAILNTIESGQAVFIENNSKTTDAVITIKESDKLSGNTLVSRPGVTAPTLEVSLFAKDNTGNETLVDGATINFDESYSNSIDNYDVRKITNTNDNIGIKQGTANLVVERRNRLVETDTIRLNITGMRVVDYKFEIDPSVLSNTGLNAFLKDKFLQTETAISLIDLTNINFSVTANAASKAADRFMIIFKTAPATNFTTIAATRNANKTITVKWGVQNEVNITNYELQHSNNGVNFTSIQTRVAIANNASDPLYEIIDNLATKNKTWYRVKLNGNAYAKFSAIAMVNAVTEDAIDSKPSFLITPNPVTGNNINLVVKNQPKGIYAVTVMNLVGQKIYNGTINILSDVQIINIDLGKNIAKGKYELLLASETRKVETLSLMLQ